MRDEGVIKFSVEWEEAPLSCNDHLADVIRIRNKLFRKGLIGVYPDGIGFGNVSVLCEQPRSFLISGSQTGGVECSSPDHFSLVTNWNIEDNKLNCKGPVKASSESLTHATLYDLDDSIKAVVHIHHAKLWTRLLRDFPATSKDIAYGTPQMALEVSRLFKTTLLPKQKVFVMAGHKDGVVSFGNSAEDATENLLLIYENFIEGRIS